LGENPFAGLRSSGNLISGAEVDDLVKSEASRPQGGACGELAGQNSMAK